MQEDDVLKKIFGQNAVLDANAVSTPVLNANVLRGLTEDVLSTLTPREKEIVKMRFGLDRSGRERSAKEVGSHFNLSDRRIRQIEAKAFAKLRHPSRSRRLRAFLDGLTDTAELSGIVIQAVITLGDRTPDGSLVVALAPAWFEIIRVLEKDSRAMFEIPWRKWEEIIAGAYERAGFDKVTLTPRSGDHGRDVIAEKSGWGSVRFIDQVKAYKPGHLVTAEEVRALGFVLLSDPAANKGIVTTTSDFAPKIAEDASIKQHMPNRIELVNGPSLLKRLKELATDDFAKPYCQK